MLAETLGYAVAFSSPWRGKRCVFERRKPVFMGQLQPSTNSDKLSVWIWPPKANFATEPMLLLEVFCTPGIDYISRQVYRQLMRNELARFYHHRTRKCLPPKKLRRTIQ